MISDKIIDLEISLLDMMLSASRLANSEFQKISASEPVEAVNISYERGLKELEEHDSFIRLDSVLKNKYEQIFDADLGNVRIHTGKYAQELTRRRGADAVTYGSDIYFANGKYAPDTKEGLTLLSHELYHVLQFKNGISLNYKEDLDAAEYDAEKVEYVFSSSDSDTLTKFAIESAGIKSMTYSNNVSQTPHIMEKRSSFSDVSAEDFGRGGEIFYELHFPSGISLKMTKKELEKFYDKFKDRVDEWLTLKSYMISESEYRKMISRLFSISGMLT